VWWHDCNTLTQSCKKARQVREQQDLKIHQLSPLPQEQLSELQQQHDLKVKQLEELQQHNLKTNELLASQHRGATSWVQHLLKTLAARQTILMEHTEAEAEAEGSLKALQLAAKNKDKALCIERVLSQEQDFKNVVATSKDAELVKERKEKKVLEESHVVELKIKVNEMRHILPLLSFTSSASFSRKSRLNC
jgi:hypothetical protein